MGRRATRSAASVAEAALLFAALLSLVVAVPGRAGAAPQSGVTAASASQAGEPAAFAAQASESRGTGAAKERLTLADLPVAAEGAISRVLGRDAEAYHVRAREDGRLEAGNPRHGVRAVFGAEGVELRAGEETWRLRWASIAGAGVGGPTSRPWRRGTASSTGGAG